METVILYLRLQLMRLSRKLLRLNWRLLRTCESLQEAGRNSLIVQSGIWLSLSLLQLNRLLLRLTRRIRELYR